MLVVNVYVAAVDVRNGSFHLAKLPVYANIPYSAVFGVYMQS